MAEIPEELMSIIQQKWRDMNRTECDEQQQPKRARYTNHRCDNCSCYKCCRHVWHCQYCNLKKDIFHKWINKDRQERERRERARKRQGEGSKGGKSKGGESKGGESNGDKEKI